MFLLLLVPMICTFSLLYGRSCTLWTDYNRKNMQENNPLKPNNTIIIFDLHGVLFHHQYATMMKTFWRSEHKWHLLVCLLNPCLVWDIFKLLYRRPVPESFFVHLGHKHEQIKKAMPLLIEIANCQTPDPDMINLVHTLKNDGFKLGVLSNIGEQIFADLYAMYQELFDMFDIITVAAQESNYASKPNPKMYQLFVSQIDEPMHKVFIDDKEKNICGGLPFGMIGCRFRSYEKLTERLRQLGIEI